MKQSISAAAAFLLSPQLLSSSCSVDLLSRLLHDFSPGNEHHSYAKQYLILSQWMNESLALRSKAKNFELIKVFVSF